MKTLVIIPARYASSRLPGKPLSMINGKPMIQHVFERIKSAFEHVYIATDDERIANVAQKFSAPCIMTSDQHQSGTDRCQEAMQIIENKHNINFNTIINVQGDEPLIDPKAVKLLESIMTEPDKAIGTLIRPIATEEVLWDNNIPKVVVTKELKALYFSRQTIPYLRGIPKEEWLKKHTFYKHIGLYAFRKDILNQITKLPISSLEKAEKLEQNRWLEAGYNIHCAITKYNSISVDTPKDLEKIKSII